MSDVGFQKIKCSISHVLHPIFCIQYSKILKIDTIVALATPAGIGAIGVIRLSGPEAFSVADKLFHGKKLAAQKSHTVHFGTIQNADGRIIDEVLCTVFVAPHSYTKENVVEVSCHGSAYILQEILGMALQNGARMAERGEFTRRAFLNGQMDLSQAEAVADLIASSNAANHDVAMRQMRGGFTQQIKKLRDQLLHFSAMIELELDFGEEDVTFADRDDLKNLLHTIQKVVKELLQSFALGNVIKNGITTVIAGRPNAGKSTLLNTFLNEERAIVSEIPGTTRDTIEEILNINGVAFRLIDTAGIREATDIIETIGVQRTFDKIRDAAVVLYIADVSELSPKDILNDLKNLEPHQTDIKIIVVLNQIDKFSSEQLQAYEKSARKTLAKYEPVIFISAKNETDVLRLKNALYEKTVGDALLNNNEVIVTNARHAHALQQADKNLTAALDGLMHGKTSDLIALDIRHTLHHLAAITGEISNDDVLGLIFSTFCIGK